MSATEPKVTMSKWSELSWRERLHRALAKAQPAVATLSLAGLRGLVQKRASAMFKRMAAGVPEYSPGDPFSAEPGAGRLLLD